ncbi:MAG TPA: 2-oxo acid dehydrogenase subunit E2 [Gemmatimonadales bacterium]|nr:2-oxo acid dehydrogenase subunit E2 [Gemmatimonadales bacterium]
MTDVIDIVLPSDQTEGTTNVIGKWYKAVGDSVRINDPLVEITTDKVTVEIAAPGDGVLAEILAAEGENVEPGQLVGRITVPSTSLGAGSPSDHVADQPVDHTPVKQSDGDSTPTQAELTPAVRRLLKEKGLDPSQVKGSGKGGRITAEDVEAAASDGRTGGRADGPSLPGRRVPHTQMRRSIATHMAKSVTVAPHVTSVFEADLSAVAAHRDANKSAFAANGAKLTYTAYFVRAMVEAVRAVPEANARWHDDALEIWDDVNVGIATALGNEGLIVPVLRQAQNLDLAGTAKALHDFTERARTNALTPKDVQDGTITISNHGVSGSLLAAPIIINQPQSSILGVGKLEQRAVVRDGTVVARPMAYVTITIDHRVLDGFSANKFLTKWVETIENWK